MELPVLSASAFETVISLIIEAQEGRDAAKERLLYASFEVATFHSTLLHEISLEGLFICSFFIFSREMLKSRHTG